MAVTQNIANFSRELPNESGSHRGIIGIGHGELSRQWQPKGGHGTGEVKFPAIPPAVIAGFGPVSLGVNAGVRDNPLLPMFLVPDPTVSPEHGAIHGGGSP
jgi:hypothetical protein